MFIIVVTGIFVFAGLLHPEEFMNLIPGVLYFLCIPSGFLLMFIYAMINMKNVSWGTREMPNKVESMQHWGRVITGLLHYCAFVAVET